MGSKRRLKSGDLVTISTPAFYGRALNAEIEGRTGVIVDIKELETPYQSDRPTKIYNVLIEGTIIAFYSDRYIQRA